MLIRNSHTLTLTYLNTNNDKTNNDDNCKDKNSWTKVEFSKFTLSLERNHQFYKKSIFDTFTSLFQLRKINRENKRNLDEKPTVLNNISSVELNQKYGIKTLVGIKPIVWN